MWKVVLWAQILLLVGCGSGPQFCDYYDPQDLQSPRTFQVMNASPIVLVGTVRSTTVISRGLPARKQSTLRLDLMKAEITVENSLRAALQSTDAQFYYFEFSPMNGGYSGPPRYHLDRADRRVFFLTRDSGVLRSSGDVLDYTLR